MSTQSTVLISHDGAVTIIAINRPARKNAVDGATARLLFEAFQAFDADAKAAVAVLVGEGDTFCAGADLKAVATGDLQRRRDISGRDTIAPMGPSRMVLSKPVVAAIEGHAVAGGMELALWADMRVVGAGAVFGIYCRRFGVPLIDGGTIRLPRLIGQSRAMDLILTGRPVKAEEALAMGLANRVVADGTALAEAIKIAHQLAAFPQGCLRNDMRSVNAQWDLDFDAALMDETRGGLDVISSGETVAGASRFASGVGRHGTFE
jgi:enoyl-CoA hydratase